jgi:acetyl-CoA carboxylase biotin carboxyl carrier protein
MDIRKVKKLIELLEESGISEIEIKEGEESVRISRHPTGPITMQAPVSYATPAAMPRRPRPHRPRTTR